MKQVKQIPLCAMLVAMALALSYTERFLPLQLVIPLPGIKIGLANIVTVVALSLFRIRYAAAILALRCILGAIFGGGITGLAFSLCGGFLALGAMAGAGKTGLFSVYGISVLGAAAHSVGQILAAMVLMNSWYVGAYLPWLLLASVFTGLLVGCICAGVLRVLPKAGICVPAPMHRCKFKEDDL